MKYRLLSTLLLISGILNAQYEKLLHKNYQERAKLLGNFWETKTVNNQYDSTKFFDEVMAIRKMAAQHRDAGLEMDTYMMELSFFLYRKKYRNNTALGLEKLEKVLKISHDKQLLTEASVEKHFGSYYFYRVKNYELAFEHFLRMYDLIKDKNQEEFPDKVNCINELVYCYYYFSDYPKSIEYAKAAIKSEYENHTQHFLSANYSLIGTCFREMNQLDSSDHYFKASLETAQNQQDTLWLGRAGGQLGYNCFLRKQYPQAELLLKKAVAMTKQKQDARGAANALIPLGAIALLNNHLPEANALLLEAKKQATFAHKLEVYEKLYPWLSKLYIRLNRPELATMYADSAAWTTDSLHRQFNARKMIKALQEKELRQHRAELNEVENQKRIKELERNGVIVLLAAGLFLALYIYTNQRRKYLQKQLIISQELKLKEQELSLAVQELQRFALNISEKNKMVEELQQKLGDSVTYETLERLQRSTILTDEQWESFRQLFEKVHGGYLHRVKEKLPVLTPAEIRFMALAKLQFSNKEMAAVLGVSSNGIRSIWFRLRKKLNLSEEGSIEELLETIG